MLPKYLSATDVLKSNINLDNCKITLNIFFIYTWKHLAVKAIGALLLIYAAVVGIMLGASILLLTLPPTQTIFYLLLILIGPVLIGNVGIRVYEQAMRNAVMYIIKEKPSQ